MALTRNSPGVVIVDDTESAWIYEPPSAWGRNGVVEEYNGTTHNSGIATSTATFRFNGTAVAIYGTSAAFAVSKYVVDDLPPVIFNSPDPASQVSTYHTLYYQSPVLGDGPHRVVITCLSNRTDSQLWIDYAIYQPSGSQSPPSASSTSLSSPSTSAASQKTTSGANTTAIVGGVLGALVLAMVLVLLFFIRRRSPRDPKILTLESRTVPPTPFEIPASTAMDRAPVQMISTFPLALAEQPSRAYVKPRLPSDTRARMDPSPVVGQRLASAAGSSSGDGRQYPDARPNAENINLGSHIEGQGQRPEAMEGRENNGHSSSASVTTGRPMSPETIPPAYSYRPY